MISSMFKLSVNLFLLKKYQNISSVNKPNVKPGKSQISKEQLKYFTSSFAFKIKMILKNIKTQLRHLILLNSSLKLNLPRFHIRLIYVNLN